MMVRIVDLITSDGAVGPTTADVCVVGAGAAGIYTAVGLASRGLDVVLLEAGGAAPRDPAAQGFRCGYTHEEYRGASVGRFFGLGGTTARWGGVLVPHLWRDAEVASPSERAIWERIVLSVERYGSAVLRRLGYRGPVDFVEYPDRAIGGPALSTLRQSGFDVLADLALPPRHRRLDFLLRREPAVDSGSVHVMLHACASVCDLRAEAADNRLERVVARAPGGRETEIRADAFVLAAGALESARILLEIAETYPSLSGSLAGVGRFLSDHLSLPIAEVPEQGRAEAVGLFRPRFWKSWMRRFRFLERDRPDAAPRAFLHFVFDTVCHPAFALAKELVAAAQERRRPCLSDVSMLRGISGLWGVARERYLHSALYVPADARIVLQLDIEQRPRAENRIVLSEERDVLGRRVPTISWSIAEEDLRAIEETAERVLAKWTSARAGLPALRPLPLRVDATKVHDVYHTVGVCRMGTDADSVVDEGLRVRDVENLWVVSTAVFPSAGTANPTFSMLCLAEDLVQRLIELLA